MQAEMFPPTVPELLAAYRARLAGDVEDTLGRLVKAQTKHDEATDALALFDRAMRAQEAPPDEAAEARASMELYEAFMAEDGELGLRMETPTVTVSGPAVEPFTMSVGSRTRFAALVYAYAEEVGIAAPDPAEWDVVAECGDDIDQHDVIGAQFYGEAFRVERAKP